MRLGRKGLLKNLRPPAEVVRVVLHGKRAAARRSANILARGFMLAIGVKITQ